MHSSDIAALFWNNDNDDNQSNFSSKNYDISIL